MTAPALASTQSSRTTSTGLARYRFDRGSWARPCRFIDVWDDGAALELYELSAGEPLRRQIHLETGELASEHPVTELHGMLTHGICTETGRIIVLARFWALAYQQRLLVRRLVNLRLSIRSGR